MRSTLPARAGALVLTVLTTLVAAPALAANIPTSSPSPAATAAAPEFRVRATVAVRVERSAKAKARAKVRAAVSPKAKVTASASATAWAKASARAKVSLVRAASTPAAARAAAHHGAQKLAHRKASTVAERRAERRAEVRAHKKARTKAHGRALERSRATFGRKVIRQAKAKAGRPYVYGAVGPNAFDCSGLVLYVMHKMREYLPRTADQQYHATRKISRSRAVPGDLVFFHHSYGHVYHVGIYAGQGMIWHAPHTGDHVRLAPIFSSRVTFGRV
jgi:cell wall-associated NlpC family hydrolase